MIRQAWGRKACEPVSEEMEGNRLLIRLAIPAGSWEGMQAPLHEPRCSGQLSRYPAYLQVLKYLSKWDPPSVRS